MGESFPTEEGKTSPHADADPSEREELGLIVAWSVSEPERVGEIAFFRENEPHVFGRETTSGARTVTRAAFFRQRPGLLEPRPALVGGRISREQLRIVAVGDELRIENIGRCELIVRGEPADRCVLRVGETVRLRSQLVFLCVRRRKVMPSLRTFPAGSLDDFGEPDAFAILGESPIAHQLRESIAWTAHAAQHVLVLGPSGAGKELTARALHALSPRARKAFVARNAATIPAGLVDAELFGNLKNYPNPGMNERPGLIGEAQGGTLFLDEIGELPEAAQAHLLRVLDAGGEYHRLGESVPRRADVRLIMATNRAPETLKHDLLARMPLRIDLPGLDRRREDVPLLARHLIKRAHAKSPEITGRFLDERGEPRFSAELIEQLVAYPFTTHVRELDALLWRAMSTSAGEVIDWPKDAEPAPSSDRPSRPSSTPSAPEASAEAIRAALAASQGNVTQAARALGISSRYALYRRMRKLGITLEGGRLDDE